MFSHFVCTSTEGAEFAFWFAGVSFRTLAYATEYKPWLENFNTSKWQWWFFALVFVGHHPYLWPCFRKVKVLRLAKQSCQFAQVVHNFKSPASLGLQLDRHSADLLTTKYLYLACWRSVAPCSRRRNCICP